MSGEKKGNERKGLEEKKRTFWVRGGTRKSVKARTPPAFSELNRGKTGYSRTHSRGKEKMRRKGGIRGSRKVQRPSHFPTGKGFFGRSDEEVFRGASKKK